MLSIDNYRYVNDKQRDLENRTIVNDLLDGFNLILILIY